MLLYTFRYFTVCKNIDILSDLRPFHPNQPPVCCQDRFWYFYLKSYSSDDYRGKVAQHYLTVGG